MLSAKSNFVRSLIRIVGSLCLFVVLSTGVAICQTETPNPQRGFYPGGSYSVSDIEAINTVTGNLTFKIPLATLPLGRGGLSASVYLTYNSKLWDTTPVEYYDDDSTLQYYTAMVESQEGGWHYDYQYVFKELWRPEYLSYSCGTPESQNIHKVQIRFPDGSLHDFAPLGYSGSHGYYRIQSTGYQWNCTTGTYSLVTSGTMTYYSTDGTYLRLDVAHGGSNAWTLYFPNGTKVTGNNGPERITDRNGNYIEFQNITYNSNPTEKIVDQFGRYILIEHASAATIIRQSGTALTTEITGTTINTNTRMYSTDPTGNPPDYIVHQYLPMTTGVSQITSPVASGGTGLSYAFGYTHGVWVTWWGEVTSVTLPSGASAAYSYGGATYPTDFSAILHDYVASKALTYQPEYDGSSLSPITDTWTYTYSSYPNFHTDITAPDGGVTSQYYYDPNSGAIDWHSGLVYKTLQPDGSTIEQIWQQNIPNGLSTGVDNAVNPYVKTEFRSIKTAGGTLDKTAIKDYTYDKNGNVTESDEYDWTAYGNVPRTSGNPTGPPTGATPTRVTVNTYFSPTPVASDSTTSDADAYHKSTSPNLKNVLESSEVRSGFSSSLALGRSELGYDSTTTTGNVTEQKSWDSTKGSISRPLTSSNWVEFLHGYDSYGNLTSTTDPRSNQTTFTYGTVKDVSGNPVYDYNSVLVQNLYVTQTLTAVGTGVAETTTTERYDFDKGRLLQAVDPNSVTIDTTYDVFARPTLVTTGAGTSLERRTATEYNDVGRYVISRSDLTTAGDGQLISIQHYDQLGRPRLTQALEVSTDSTTVETTGIKSQSRILVNGNYTYRLVSNPYRATTSSGASGEATMGWTRTKIDQRGRVVEVESFSGATAPAPWGANTTSTGKVTTDYDSEFTTVTDQAGKLRRSRSNGLGQLVRVDEPDNSGSLGTTSSPTQSTGYTYDVLGNLTQVSQGSQTRTFTYTSLGRLASAANPESGTVSYTYDNNGNLLTRTDAIGNVTTMSTYDALNRITGKSYSVVSPTVATSSVTYKYDNQSLDSCAPSLNRGPSIGRLVAVTTGTCSGSNYSGNFYGYNGLGQVTEFHQRTDNYNYKTDSITYNKSGFLTGMTYPSGRTVTMSPDTAGRLSQVISNSTTLVSSITYAAHGGLASENYGNGLIHAIDYNARLQPTEIKLGVSGTPASKLDLQFGYGTTANNGNILTQSIGVSTSVFNQSYGYDTLNRLTSAQETPSSGTGWSQAFTYDRYGNRSVSSSTSGILTFNPSPTIDTTTNRFVTTGGAFAYDGAGNLTQEITASGSLTSRFYTYDAENHLIEAKQGGSLGTATTTGGYVYDSEGRRVKKTTSDNLRMVYNSSGQLLAEYDLSGSATVPTKEYVYGVNGLLATIDSTNGTLYTTSDHLGSPRVVTDSNKNPVERHDYVPFGEEIPTSFGNRNTITGYGVDILRQKFTSKERDTETGLDFFDARYYASVQGRFTSVDPIYFQARMVKDPQSFNLYTYARNNPLVVVDPDGQSIRLLGKNIQEAEQALDALKQAVGPQAAQYLYINIIPVTDSDGNVIQEEYYVAVYGGGPNGDGPDFASINDAAKDLNDKIFNDPHKYLLKAVPEGTPVNDLRTGDRKVIGPLDRDKGISPGATVATFLIDDKVIKEIVEVSYILSPSTNPGTLPGSLMSDNKASPITSGEVAFHELGHQEAGLKGIQTLENDRSALRLEDKARKAVNKEGPSRNRETANGPILFP